MTNTCWDHQKSRLIDRFGKNNFSSEFSLLVAIECRSIPDHVFVDMVGAMIGARKPSDPPLIRDFRDARLAYERREYERNLYGAARAMHSPVLSRGLQDYLGNHFPGCKTIMEAVEVRRHQIEIQRAEDPSYDPMMDERWMGPVGVA